MGKAKKTTVKTISKKQAIFLERIEVAGIETALGGKNSISYKMLYDLCDYEFSFDFAAAFDVSSYLELPADRFDEAVVFIAEWLPDDVLFALSDLIEELFSEYIDRFFEDMPKNSPAYQQLMEDFINAVCTSSERSD